ncbi:MAG: hypothetical protein ISS56_12380 [Anaerolineae bacterium]|nr:hypothetical protein [Anaerolineae bacterium]
MAEHKHSVTCPACGGTIGAATRADLFLLISLQGGLETGVSNLARLLPIGFAIAA